MAEEQKRREADEYLTPGLSYRPGDACRFDRAPNVRSVLHVTFDRNVANAILVRSRHPQPDEDTNGRLWKAIQDGRIQPYISEATLTFELFTPGDRLLILANYFARGETRPSMPKVSAGQVNWLHGLLALGCRVLRAPPRIGLTAGTWTNLDENSWAKDDRVTMAERQERSIALVTRFEDAPLTRLRRWGEELARVHGLNTVPHNQQPYSRLPGLLWYNGLMAEYNRPKSCRDHPDFLGKLRKIFSDWCDLDAVASHYGYGLDYFCTYDAGRGTPAESVLHPKNREVLAQDFDVQIVCPRQLVELLYAPRKG